MLVHIFSLDKVFSGCFRQTFFSFGRQKKWSLAALDRWFSCTVTIVREFAWMDSALVVLDSGRFTEVVVWKGLAVML